ncbi:MAG: DUF3131 domain-containing protein [Sulfurovum sp.]|nr:DUF3131 domain-containing protein [Sulfurovum sp.]
MKTLLLLFLFSSLNMTALYPGNSLDKNDINLELLRQLFSKEEPSVLKLNPNDPCKLKSQPTEEELEMAGIAWKYFEKNYQEKTGLTNAGNKYPSASVWDWANGVYGMFAAKKLGIISQEKFENMLHKFLRTMQEMKMFNNELPNKTYSTKHAYMTNYRNKQIEDGTGWSVADIARLFGFFECSLSM